MIRETEDFFSKGCGRCARCDTPSCSARRWADGLAELRRICLAEGLTETAKWGHPCYMHAGRNIAILAALRDDFRLTFFDAALLPDPDKVLERQGPNARHASMIRLRDAAAAIRLRPIIRACLHEAKRNAEAGIRPPKDAGATALPDELAEALDADPELAEAFHGLTPGRQRSYAINLASAKKPETRRSRIERFRSRILAGKGALDR
jgi:uncharacterized protein YdeI (YjbR/CyaY-like superfamily)